MKTHTTNLKHPKAWCLWIILFLAFAPKPALGQGCVDAADPVISCPPNQAMLVDYSCYLTVADFTSFAIATDDCGPVSITQVPAPGSILVGVSNTTVTLTATDAAGRSGQCSFTLFPLDQIDPLIVCPGDITREVGADCRYIVEDFRSFVTAADNCGPAPIQQSPPAGSIYFGGNITMNFITVDGSGNIDVCNFTVTVEAGTSLHFDGIDDRVDIPDNDATDFSATQDFTVELWVKIPSTPQPNTQNNDVDILEKLNPGAGYPYAIRYLKDSRKIVVLRNSTGANPSVTSFSTFDDNRWHHLAFVKNGSTLRLYVDGQEENNTIDNTSGVLTGTGTINIGHRILDNYFRGAIDELRFWNVARTPTQINDNRFRALTGTETGLVGYYPFNEGKANSNNAVSVIKDRSNTGNDGSLFNFAQTGSVSNWTIGAPVTELDSDQDGSLDSCDLCQGDDRTGDTDGDGLCDDIDPVLNFPCDDITLDLSPGLTFDRDTTLRVADALTAANTLTNAAQVTYTAGQKITLKAGFHAQAGGTFTARIEPCVEAVLAEAPPLALPLTRARSEDIQVQLYPNPFREHTTLELTLDRETEVSVEIRDLTGGLVQQLLSNQFLQAGAYTHTLQLPKRPSGLYLAVIRAGDRMITRKLMLVRN